AGDKYAHELVKASRWVADVLDDVVVEDDLEAVVGERKIENASFEQLEIRQPDDCALIPLRFHIDSRQFNVEKVPDVDRFMCRSAARNQKTIAIVRIHKGPD
ncbi:MAG: hypothetical protein QG655_203, partial [Actinomycetota bacterium]|nr:hypothetical protein [Actinomycetota bacterium]